MHPIYVRRRRGYISILENDTFDKLTIPLQSRPLTYTLQHNHAQNRDGATFHSLLYLIKITCLIKVSVTPVPN